MLLKKSKLRKNFGITPKDLKSVKDFMQGAVYCWVKNREDEFFSVRDLMGGANFEWAGTPLFCLYQKHMDKGKTQADAIKEAGKDLGWILKSVLNEDKRIFETISKDLSNGYKWVN